MGSKVRRRAGEHDVIDEGQEVTAEVFGGMGNVRHGGRIVEQGELTALIPYSIQEPSLAMGYRLRLREGYPRGPSGKRRRDVRPKRRSVQGGSG